MLLRCFALCLLAIASSLARAEEGAAAPTTLELQVELHRRGFSTGSIDGVPGPITMAALRAFQRGADLEETGIFDGPTSEVLILDEPALGTYVFTAADLAGLHPVPGTWLEKSQMDALGYATGLEMAAERFHASPNLLRRLNPGINWDALGAGVKIVVPAVDGVTTTGVGARIVITLGTHELEVIRGDGQVMAHFPVSIARMAEKRPVGELHITVVIPHPNYTFDPELFPESAEGQSLGRKLILPPGPNNPVGVVWIGLDRPGYGIHGTPEPEEVGRTESHGCFRLANWDVLTLAGLVREGMAVIVEP